MNVIKKIQVDGVDYDIQAKELTKVTYAELKEMRDNGGLTAGHLYRITDYEFRTKQTNTKNAGHPFDVIVLAVAENQLSELARAIQHEGDTYFDGNDLGAWELWYDLDNDTDKYEWADAENGKGVIYRMIDEKRNDCPYDFKNALFYNNTPSSPTTTDKYYYTFSYVVSGVLYDGTVEKQVTNCHDNSMRAYFNGSKTSLNLIVFRNEYFFDNCHSNAFGNDCRNNTFGKSCDSNTFGISCHSNAFGNDCNNNTFRNNCYSNTFGNNCSSNTFGNNCYSNAFGNNCSSNTFGDNCKSNNYLQGCSSNNLGDDCSDNTFRMGCKNNSFGDNCSSNDIAGFVSKNTFGDNCSSNNIVGSSNSFGDNCSNNTFSPFGGSSNNNTFGNDCSSNTFGGSSNNNTFGNNCSSNTFGDNCHSNTFGNDCKDNTFGKSCEKNTFENYVCNRELNIDNTSITLNDEYYDDGSGQLVPVKHPDLSTQPSILPYKFMGQYVYEQLTPVKVGDRVVDCEFVVERPMILSAGVFGVNSFKNVDIMATKSEALLLNTESELDGYINVKYTDASQLLPSNGYGYGDNNTESELPILIDFGVSPDGTKYVYDSATETLSLYKSGEITQESIPQNLQKENIISIILNDGVTGIGEGAFDGCNSLTSITIPESVTSIGDDAFYKCSNLTAVHISSIEAWCNIGFAKFYSNPLNYAHNLYLNGELVKELVIPEGVTSIGAYAFWACSSLTSITIPEGVTSIGEYAFHGCNSLTSITIPSSVTSIGAYAFLGCNGELIVNCNIPSASSNTDGVFCGTKFTKVTIGDKVTSIGDYAFYDCDTFTSIDIPASVTSIGSGAFRHCSNLTSINIPEDSQLTSIGSNAFNSCINITFILLPKNLTSIGSNAFNNCNNLKTVINFSELTIEMRKNSNGHVAYYASKVINAGKIIDGYVFETIDGVHYLASYIGSNAELTLPTKYNGENYQIGDYAFSNRNSLTSITIPEGVTSIDEYAFSYCTNLTSVNIPENSQLISIGSKAFYNCSNLTSINIPVGVTSIGSESFNGCSSLASITCNALTPPTVDTNTFDGVNTSIPVYVPAGSVDTYKTTEVWKDFTNIQGVMGDETEDL